MEQKEIKPTIEDVINIVIRQGFNGKNGKVYLPVTYAITSQGYVYEQISEGWEKQ